MCAARAFTKPVRPTKKRGQRMAEAERTRPTSPNGVVLLSKAMPQAATDVEQRRRLRQIFDELDTDGSDELDYSELKQWLSRFGGPIGAISLKELKHVWTTADKDASDSLDFGESQQRRHS